MSGAATIIIVAEETERELEELRTLVQQVGDTLDRPIDAQLEALANQVDSVRAEVLAMRLMIENAQA